MALQLKCALRSHYNLTLAFPEPNDAAALVTVTKIRHVKASGVAVVTFSLQNDGSRVQKDIKQLRKSTKTLIFHTRFVADELEQIVLIDEIER